MTANAAMGPLTCNQFHMTSTDGLRIAGARWSNRKSPRGILQIAHGKGDHIGRYERLIIEELIRVMTISLGIECAAIGSLRTQPQPIVATSNKEPSR